MMIEDWEVGRLYWRCIDKGATPEDAARQVKHKFYDEICSAANDTHFYVGTVLAHPKNWVVVGTFYPKRWYGEQPAQGSLFGPVPAL